MALVRFRDGALLSLALALWLAVVFWPIVSLRAVNVQDDIFTSDLLNDRLPARAFVGDAVARGDWPLWIPGIYTGYPGLAQVEIGSLYPSNLALFTLLDPYAAIAFAQLLPLFLVGLGTALVSLRFGHPAPAALLAGMATSLSGFFVSHIRQLNLIDAACWLPWLMLCAERLLQRRERWGRSAALLGGVWALSLFAGHPQVSYYMALVLVPYLVAREMQAGRERGLERGARLRAALLGPVPRRFVVGIGIGTVVAAAQLVPALELASLGHRAGGLPYEMAAAYPVSPQSFWSFFSPYVNGDASDVSFRLSGIFWEQYAYLGLLPMLLAILAVVVERNDPRVRLLFGIGVVSSLLVLGPNTPLFHLAYSFVPGMRYFRFPARFLLFVEIAIALLAAFGLAHLMRSTRRRAIAAAVALVVLAATAADLWVHQRRQVPMVDWETWTRPIETVEIMRRAAAGSDEPWRYFSLESKRLHRSVHHLSRGWSGDLSHYVAFRDVLQPSFNLLVGLESPDGYANLVPHHYEAIWGSDKQRGLLDSGGPPFELGQQLTRERIRVLELFGVRYVVAAWPLRSERLEHVGTSREGILVYALREPLPRAFVVGRARIVDGEAHALELLLREDFDPRTEALVHDAGVALPEGSAPTQRVEIVERGNTRLVLEAELERPGFLVLSEGHYPGWRAWVGDSEQRIVRANVMMRGIVLPAGNHEVVFEFRSAAIRLGAATSALGVAAWFVLLRFAATAREPH